MIYVILGTTASGKTDLALDLARRCDLPLIGADAYQIYRELEKGTARPTAAELAGLTVHLIGDRSIREPINVCSYQAECRALLDCYQAQGRDVVLCGGTFLYVRAALFDYDFPEEDLEAAARYERLEDSELYAELQRVDPGAAASLHPNNRRRVLRALVNSTSRREGRTAPPRLLYPAVFLAIEREKEEVNRRIDQRVAAMVEAGLFAEAEELYCDPRNRTSALQAIGYKEVIEGRRSGKSAAEIQSDIALRTRQYAKRQRTFLRHQFKGLISKDPAELRRLVELSRGKSERSRAALGPVCFADLERLRPLVVGLGGVGAQVAESLTRLGVRLLTVLDGDDVAASNLNRQTLYDFSDIGRRKAEAAAAKLAAIDPLIDVEVLDLRLDEETVCRLDPRGITFIFDCVDDVNAKVLLAQFSKKYGIPLIAATGTGRRLDATALRLGHLSDTGEPLAKAYKRRLKEFEIDPASIDVVYSVEVPSAAQAGFIQSLPTVPNAAGLAMVSYFLMLIKEGKAI